MTDSINNEGTSNQHLPIAVQIINQKLKELPETAELSDEFIMSKVHEGLRSVKHEAYEPMLVSIGPYHYGKPKLQAMEKHKLRYLQRFRLQRGESVESYFLALRELEPKARKHYVNLPGCLESSDKLVEMMLLDGCFIIELLSRIINDGAEKNDPDDYFIRVPWMRARICLDLILLENQLPYFVLTRLNKSESGFKELAIKAFNSVLPKLQPDFQYGGGTGTEKIKHLLHLVHISFCPASKKGGDGDEGPNSKSENPAGAQSSVSPQSHEVSDPEQPLLDDNIRRKNCKDWILDKMPSVVKLFRNDSNKNENQSDRARLNKTRRVGKLQEAGVKLQKAGGDGSTSTLFDVNFNKAAGLLEIPCFIVEDFTDTLFRNLVAFEQYTHDLDPKYFSNLAAVMDELIDTEDDVKVLCHNGIIETYVGDVQAVFQLFNKLSDGLVFSGPFYYSKLCSDLNDHCARRWNTFLASFWGDYFYTPWVSLSTCAAVLLLVLTIIMTISSVKDLLN